MRNAPSTLLRSASVTVLAALTLAACGTDGSAGSTSAPAGAGTVRAAVAAATLHTTPLARIVDQRRELPAGFDVSDDPDVILPPRSERDLHSCLAVTGTSQRASEVASAEAGRDGVGYSGYGVNSTAWRYRSQAAVDQEAALLRAPRAAHCYGSVLQSLFRRYNDGAGLSAVTTSVRPRTSGEPANVAGVVTFRFRTTVPSVQRGTVVLTYVTGPRTRGCITFIGFGSEVSGPAQRRMTEAFAARVARG